LTGEDVPPRAGHAAQQICASVPLPAHAAAQTCSRVFAANRNALLPRTATAYGAAVRRPHRETQRSMDRTVMMIHGMWGTSHVWRHWRGHFEARGWRVLTPTLRHHDAPPLDPPAALGTASLLDYAADLAAEISRLPTRPAIVGHSMGGLLAQMLAARDLCPAAVLLCPAPPAGIFALHPSVVRAFLRIQLRWGWWKRPHRATWDEALFGSFNTCTDLAACRDAYAHFVHESGRVLVEIGTPFLDRRGAATVDAAKVACPLLVIGAAQDRLTPPDVVRTVARRYAAVAEYREFAGQGHWVVGQLGWAEVASCAADWLERHMPRQPDAAAAVADGSAA
jgi:pimeloyl-ACP methyl ester carboxylesterase